MKYCVIKHVHSNVWCIKFRTVFTTKFDASDVMSTFCHISLSEEIKTFIYVVTTPKHNLNNPFYCLYV